MLEFSLAHFLAKMVSYSFLLWLPFYIKNNGRSRNVPAYISAYNAVIVFVYTFLCFRKSYHMYEVLNRSKVFIVALIDLSKTLACSIGEAQPSLKMSLFGSIKNSCSFNLTILARLQAWFLQLPVLLYPFPPITAATNSYHCATFVPLCVLFHFPLDNEYW